MLNINQKSWKNVEKQMKIDANYEKFFAYHQNLTKNMKEKYKKPIKFQKKNLIKWIKIDLNHKKKR